MRRTSGSALASSQAVGAGGERRPADRPSRHRRHDVDQALREIDLDRLEHRREEVGLVGELVVQGAAGDAGGLGDLLGADVGVAVLGEQPAGGGDERGAGGGRAVGLGAAGHRPRLTSMQSVCKLRTRCTELTRSTPCRPSTIPAGTLHYRIDRARRVRAHRRSSSSTGSSSTARCGTASPSGWPPTACGRTSSTGRSAATPRRWTPTPTSRPRGVARIVNDVLDALGLHDVTLVGNDTGGAICQLLLADDPSRIGRVVLTNCDAFENFPPRTFVPLFLAAKRTWLTARAAGADAVPAGAPLPARLRPADEAAARRRAAPATGSRPALADRPHPRRHRPLRPGRRPRGAGRTPRRDCATFTGAGAHRVGHRRPLLHARDGSPPRRRVRRRRADRGAGRHDVPAVDAPDAVAAAIVGRPVGAQPGVDGAAVTGHEASVS